MGKPKHKISKESPEFLKASEIVALHISRYDKQIKELFATKDYSEAELMAGSVSPKEFHSARDKKIKAYFDCAATLLQKEKLLQFHSPGFQVEVVDEKIELKKPETPAFDPSKLSLEEKIELLSYIKRMKTSKDDVSSVNVENYEKIENSEIKTVTISAEGANIDLIRTTTNGAAEGESSITPLTPVLRLRESLKKIAATKYKAIGASLDEDESALAG